jgi:C4-dicarboxylate-binding protein DctP
LSNRDEVLSSFARGIVRNRIEENDMARPFEVPSIIRKAMLAPTVVSLFLFACAPQRAEQKPAAPAPTSAPAASGAAPAEKTEAKPAASGPAALTVKFSHVVTRDTPKGKAADKFAELVKQKSNGRIEAQVFPNSELYKDAEELEALQTGAVHFIAPGTDKFAGLAPQWDALGLPYLFQNEAAAKKLVGTDSSVSKDLFESMRPKGLLGLGIWGNGWKHFTDSKKPLQTPADFQGLKFRTSGKTDEAFVKALGASAQVMAFSEVFGALQQGVVDGQYNTWSNVLTQKFHEVQKYATVSRGGVFLTYGVATNAKWWDGLDPADRQVLSDAMNEATRYENDLADKDNDDAYKELKASNRMEWYEQTEADAKVFSQAAEKVVAEWEPKVGKEIIEKLKAMNN